MGTKGTVVLVHGAFHGAWCWQMVIDNLVEWGIDAIAIDLPGCGYGEKQQGNLNDCAQLLRNTITSCDGSVIVCGHSLGGAVITEAVDPNSVVRHLVYIAALVPDIGETALDNAPELLAGEIGKASKRIEDGSVVIDPDAAARIFYHDCDPEVSEWAVSQLCSQNPNIAMTPLTQAAWHHCDSTYVICQEDRALPVRAQERLAARCGNVVSFETSHSPMLSQPEALSNLLWEIAVKVRK